MKLFKRRKNKKEYLEYDSNSVEDLNYKLLDLEIELSYLKDNNCLKFGMGALIGCVAMLTVLFLTSTFPVWASAMLTFLSSFVGVPFIVRSSFKEKQLENQIKQIELEIEKLEEQEKRNEHLKFIEVTPAKISFGSQCYDDLIKEFNNEKQEDNTLQF